MTDDRERLLEIIAEAYQVVGALAAHTSQQDDPAIIRALDVLSFKEEGSMLPFVLQSEPIGYICQGTLDDLMRLTGEEK